MSRRSHGASNATFANSVAIGAGTTNTADNQVAVGGRTISGVNAGAVSATSTEAVNGSQLFATNQAVAANSAQVATNTGQIATNTAQIGTNTAAIGTLQTNVATNQTVAAINANLSGFQSQLDDLFSTERQDRREARRGVAAAVAMSEAPMPSRDGGVSYSLHGAAYRGEYAIGGSVKYRINHAVALDVGISHAGNSDTALRAGVSGEF